MTTKKEQKDAYKQMKFPMGVFQIRNLSNNKVMIDNSVDMLSKWNRHKLELNFGSHRNAALQKDWRENQESNFAFEILSELKTEEGEVVNYNKELRELQKLVEEELQIKPELIYK